ncbi:MAG: hypothetical protein RIC06_24000 [Cyclobacteriaceae bacterium]
MVNFKYMLTFLLGLLIASYSKEEEKPVIPPFAKGTIFMDPDIITEEDKTTFVSLSYAGQGKRTMYDHRVDKSLTLSPYLFNSFYEDGLSFEIQINPEFKDSVKAKEIALKYAEIIGRLPTDLRIDLETITIHDGVEYFRGGYKGIWIYTGQSSYYESDGILEEVFVHEGAHVSLDPKYAPSRAWVNAQELDGNYISHYARDFFRREDMAESFLAYLALRYRPDRIAQSTKDKVLETIPNRINFFDDLNLNMYPIE